MTPRQRWCPTLSSLRVSLSLSLSHTHTHARARLLFSTYLPALGDLNPRIRDRTANGILLAQQGPKRDATVGAVNHCRERKLCNPNDTHAVVNPPRSKPALRDLKPTAFTQNNVSSGDHDVVEDQLGVVRIVAHDLQRVEDGDARGVHWDENHRVLGVP